MIDRTTKILLGIIAAGLWANIAATQIRPASASTHLLQNIDMSLSTIDGNIAALTHGICTNQRLC